MRGQVSAAWAAPQWGLPHQGVPPLQLAGSTDVWVLPAACRADLPGGTHLAENTPQGIPGILSLLPHVLLCLAGCTHLQAVHPAPHTATLPFAAADAHLDAILALVRATFKVDRAALALTGADRQGGPHWCPAPTWHQALLWRWPAPRACLNSLPACGQAPTQICPHAWSACPLTPPNLAS